MSSSFSRKRSSDTMVVIKNSNSNNNNTASSSSQTPFAGSTTTTCKTRLRVRLKRFHGVAQWSWNANDDVCGICQSSFEGTAPGVKYPGEDCPVVWGRCGHAFHLQCVSKWLQSTNSKNSCPICRQEWEFGQNPVNTNGSGSTTMTTNNNNINNAGVSVPALDS